MLRSTHRTLTTHVGSLPRPADLLAMVQAKLRGETVDDAAFKARVSNAVGEVVRQQVEAGIDIVNDGEFSKSSWLAYFRGRLTNVEARTGMARTSGSIYDREQIRFPDWFAAARHGGGPIYSYVKRASIALSGAPSGVSLVRSVLAL